MRDDVLELRCPACRAAPSRGADEIVCGACGARYPVDRGVPILLPPGSHFQADGAASTTSTTSGGRARIAAALSRRVPTYSRSHGGRDRYRVLDGRLDPSRARALVVGAGDDAGLPAMLRRRCAEVVLTDVARHDGLDYVCDGHALPFADDSFDLVALPAVLEHVLDPTAVVAEVTRVLRAGGVVVAETPFLQGVHMGGYDYQRFTDLGHRWLFRCYRELARGVSAGPAVSLGWSATAFLVGFCDSPKAALAMKGIARLSLWWLHEIDRLQVGRRGASDGACALYFIGENAKEPVLTPRELVRSYRGVVR